MSPSLPSGYSRHGTRGDGQLRIWSVVFGCWLTLIAAAAAAQDLSDAEQAWRQGDPAKAVAIWTPLAAKGDATAAFHLGQAYRVGKGVALNLAEAQRWLDVAARRGHVEAQATYGLMLFQAGNRVAAIRWLKLAAEAGEPRAMLMYGTALYSGDAVSADPVAAYAWVSRSAALGLVPAQTTLADLDASLTPEQREKGLALAATMVTRKAALSAPALKTRKTDPVVKVADNRPLSVAKSLPVAQATAPTDGSWRIQLGAFSQRGSAESLFAQVEGKLGGRQAYFVPVGRIIRLQAGPYASSSSAAAACATIRPVACFPVPAPKR